tara:strand:- start:7600 stop:8367 length:768 start_codon:yes stop_codon:yes gene_type:complete
MVTLMQIIPVDFALEGLRILCVTAPIGELSLSEVQLAQQDEVATFVTEKRRIEHLSGRLLLDQALTEWGVDTSLLEVRRNQHRAPSVAYLPGTWLRRELPSISIGHSNGWAFVALIDAGWTIGIDGEPCSMKISSGVFDMMATGDELLHLQNHPDQALRYWTSKEAVQKAARLGMHLNPRKIRIPIENNEANISIGKSIFQLRNISFNGYNISVAISRGEGYDSIPEDELLRQTRMAMNETPDWGVGCKTTRNAS